MLLSRGIKSPLLKTGRGLFLVDGETGLPFDIKPLQSPSRAGITISEALWETLIASSESSSLAASSPADATAWLSSALQALSRIDCRYFPCASILIWRCRWTCFTFHNKQLNTSISVLSLRDATPKLTTSSFGPPVSQIIKLGPESKNSNLVPPLVDRPLTNGINFWGW